MKKLNKTIGLSFIFAFVFISLGFIGIQKSYAQTVMYGSSYSYNNQQPYYYTPSSCGEGGCNFVYNSAYSYNNQQQPSYYSQQQPSYYNSQQPSYYSQQQPSYYNSQQPSYYSQQQPSYYNQQQPYYYTPSSCGEGGCNFVYNSAYSPYTPYHTSYGNYY